MRKIFYVITKSNWGGAQRYVYDLATALPKTEWQVAVVMGGTGLPEAPGGRLEHELRHRDIRTVFIPAFMRDISLGREWRALRDLWDLFAVEQPDVVHLNSSKAGGLGALAARLAGVPTIIFTSHGLAYDEDRAPVIRGLIWLATWATFLCSHKIIVLSRENFERARSLPFCSRKISLIYNGIGVLKYLPRAEARAALGLPADGVVVGALGELVWNKNYHTLIRAAARLKRHALPFELCIIGEGDERTFIETLIEENELKGQVRLAGFRADGYQYLPAFDIFALPSIKEGLPYVLLEAGEAGLPVVGSSISGVIDILSEGAGLLVKPKDEGALADALELLIKNPTRRAQLGAALQKSVRQKFSLERMVQETLALY